MLGDPAVGAAEGEALFEDEAVRLLGGVELGGEGDPLRHEAQVGQGRGEEVAGGAGEVAGAEEGGLQALQVAVVAAGELGAARQRLDQRTERDRGGCVATAPRRRLSGNYETCTL